MNCPKCGYAMSDLEAECPRCKLLAQQQPASAPLPPVQSSEPFKPASPKTPVLDLTKKPRRDPRLVALIALGVAVLLLLGALLYVLLHQTDTGTQVAQAPAQEVPPVQVTGPAVAVVPQESAVAATTEAGAVAQVPAVPLPPAATTAEGLAMQPQETVQPLTTGAQGVAAGKEEGCDPSKVVRWKTIYNLQGSGLTMTTIKVECPWRARFYTGVSPASELGLDNFTLAIPVPGMQEIPMAIASVSAPNKQGETIQTRSGTLTLTIATSFNNWTVLIDQGYFH